MAASAFVMSLKDQTNVLEALDMLQRSCERAARATKNPELIKCHEARARDAQELIGRVVKAAV